MKNTLFLALFFAFAGVSCVTQRKCLNKFPPVVEIKDSIVYKEKIIIRDTIVTIKLPADTIQTEVQIPVIRVLAPVTVESKYAKATASIDFVKEKIRLVLIQKDTEIQIRIDSAIREAKYWRDRYVKDHQKVIVNVPYTPKIMKWSAWFGWFCAVIILLYIAYRFLRR